MKIRDMIRLIVLVLVVVFLGLWAFGGLEGVTIGTTRFLRWDGIFRKGADIGSKYTAIYTISAPEDAGNFDVSAATLNAKRIFEKRLNALGAEGVLVRQMNGNAIRVELPGATGSSEVDEFLHNPGLFKVTQGDDLIFTNKDVKSVKMVGYDATSGQVYVDVHLNNDAKERLANLTGPGTGSLSISMDGTEVSATYSSSETIKNGVMRLPFSTSNYTKALMLAICVDSGLIDATITVSDGMQTEGSASGNAADVLGIAALAMVLVAVVYLIAAHKLLGVSAAISLLISVIALDFFGATFTWLRVNACGAAGLALSILIITMAHIAALFAVRQQFALGKSLTAALDDGMTGVRAQLLELLAIPAVIGIGLWIAGGDVSAFGIALFGGSLLAAASSLLLIRHIAKIFIGIGLSDAAAYGLKRGE
ncbi:MAG: hypothetical protein J6X30_02495 [Clostridia bacterium]|nr:hypothetical protein [Clostridia bacterium]